MVYKWNLDGEVFSALGICFTDRRHERNFKFLMTLAPCAGRNKNWRITSLRRNCLSVNTDESRKRESRPILRDVFLNVYFLLRISSSFFFANIQSIALLSI